MAAALLLWICRLCFSLTAAKANVVSTHGGSTQMEVTSSGDVVRTDSRATQVAEDTVTAEKVVDVEAGKTARVEKVADAVSAKTAQVAKSLAFGFDNANQPSLPASADSKKAEEGIDVEASAEPMMSKVMFDFSSNPEPSKKAQNAKAMAVGFNTFSDPDTAQESYLETEHLASPPEPPPFVTTMKNEGNGSFYTINLCFGRTVHEWNPLKPMKEMCLPGIPDTGSFELVVRSSRCKKCQAPFYNDSQSTTFVGTPSKKNETKLMYGSGPVKALWVRDQVMIEGSNDGSSLKSLRTWTSFGASSGIVVQDQLLLESLGTPIADFAKGSAMCGIYGIGRGVIKGRQERFIARAGIKRYSICLPRDDHKNGTMIWSSADVKNNPHYTKINVVGQYHWAVQLDHMRFIHSHKQPFQISKLTTGKSCAILDSGTTLIAPTTEMAAKISLVVGQNWLNCHDIDKLPVLEFKLDGKTFRLPPEAYVAQFDIDADPDAQEDKAKKKHYETLTEQLMHFDPTVGCMLLLTKPMDFEQPNPECPLMILGMPFFRFYKTVFDWEAPSELNATNKGMVYTTEHSDCEDNANSWNTTAVNFKGPVLTQKQKKLMKVNLNHLKFPKSPAHYLQHGKI